MSPLAWRRCIAGVASGTRMLRRLISPAWAGWNGRPQRKQKWPRSEWNEPFTWFQRIVMLETTWRLPH